MVPKVQDELNSSEKITLFQRGFKADDQDEKSFNSRKSTLYAETIYDKTNRWVL